MGDSRNDMNRALRPYRALIDKFIAGTLSADAFETAYLARYLSDDTRWDRELFDILDTLFAEVDDYVGDPELRARAGGLDGPALRECAEKALRRLDHYTGS